MQEIRHHLRVLHVPAALHGFIAGGRFADLAQLLKNLCLLQQPPGGLFEFTNLAHEQTVYHAPLVAVTPLSAMANKCRRDAPDAATERRGYNSERFRPTTSNTRGRPPTGGTSQSPSAPLPNSSTASNSQPASITAVT